MSFEKGGFGEAFRIGVRKKLRFFCVFFRRNLNLCRRRIVINTFMVEGTISYKFEFIWFFFNMHIFVLDTKMYCSAP